MLFWPPIRTFSTASKAKAFPFGAAQYNDLDKVSLATNEHRGLQNPTPFKIERTSPCKNVRARANEH